MTNESESMTCIDCNKEFRKGGSSLYRQGYYHNWKTDHEDFIFKGTALKINMDLVEYDI